MDEVIFVDSILKLRTKGKFTLKTITRNIVYGFVQRLGARANPRNRACGGFSKGSRL
jgi:hypothetical protein